MLTFQHVNFYCCVQRYIIIIGRKVNIYMAPIFLQNTLTSHHDCLENMLIVATANMPEKLLELDFNCYYSPICFPTSRRWLTTGVMKMRRLTPSGMKRVRVIWCPLELKEARCDHYHHWGQHPVVALTQKLSIKQNLNRLSVRHCRCTWEDKIWTRRLSSRAD